MTLAEQVALVTGGSSGLGRAIVTALARAGAAVAFTYRANAAAAQALVEELSPAGTLVAWQGNVDSEADVARFIAETVARFGRLGILVNNAGIIRDSLVLRMRPEDWQGVIETDLIGAGRCCRPAVAHLVARGRGRIPLPGWRRVQRGGPCRSFRAVAAPEAGNRCDNPRAHRWRYRSDAC